MTFYISNEMPLTTMCKDDRAYLGVLVKVRWKLYDAEILKVSGECFSRIVIGGKRYN